MRTRDAGFDCNSQKEKKTSCSGVISIYTHTIDETMGVKWVVVVVVVVLNRPVGVSSDDQVECALSSCKCSVSPNTL